jgi:hypothetical protein
MKSFQEVTFPFDPKLRELFIQRDSNQILDWSTRYPDLFDSLDIEIARHQAPREKGGQHFFEWLAAILIYESTGHLSLVESYQAKRHKRKQELLRKILPDPVHSLVTNGDGVSHAQAPDLLVYSPDCTSYFFCEAKGPRDRLRSVQSEYFETLALAAKRPILIARFVPCTPWQASGLNPS